MKRTAACLAGLLMLVLLAGCKEARMKAGHGKTKETLRHREQFPFSMRPMTDFI